MKRILSAILIAGACLAAAVAPAVIPPAVAQTPATAAPAAAPAPAGVTVAAPAGGTIPIGELWTDVAPIVSSVLGVVITALVGWAAAKFTQWTGVQIEQKYQDDLHSAAQTGANLALSRIGSTASALTIRTKQAAVADAVGWMIKSVPDAIGVLGVSGDKLAALAESKLNALLGTAAHAPTAQAPAAPTAKSA